MAETRNPIQTTFHFPSQASFDQLVPRTYTGIYSLHKYWSKKPYNLVRAYIEKYSEEGDIVLDPFCGSGITAIESLITRRKAVALDLNPMASFITKMSVIPVDIHRLTREFDALKKKVKPKVDSLYQTVCPSCQQQATTTHTIWHNETPRRIWYSCKKCNLKSGRKSPDENDLNFISEINSRPIQFWYPKNRLLENSRINAFKDMSIPDLFTKRNLSALSLLFKSINEISDGLSKDILRFTFTAAISQASNMVFVVKRRGRMEGSVRKEKEEVGSWVIGYWIPKEHFEINAWRCFENRFRKILKGKKESNTAIGPFYQEATSFERLLDNKTSLIYTGTAKDLSLIPDASVDYVFTDPPHGDRMPYFELSLFWSSWLGFPLDFDNEIVVSDSKERDKSLDCYRNDLYQSFSEIYRILKPGKFFSVAFNNLDDDTWLVFMDVCYSIGFEVKDVQSMMYSARSVVQDSRKGGLKSDFVITCKKGERTKPFISNIWVEPIENLATEIDLVSNKILSTNDGIYIYEILNQVIPRMISQGRGFRISDIIKLLKTKLTLKGLKFYKD
jgi:DNA modification methylase